MRIERRPARDDISFTHRACMSLNDKPGLCLRVGFSCNIWEVTPLYIENSREIRFLRHDEDGDPLPIGSYFLYPETENDLNILRNCDVASVIRNYGDVSGNKLLIIFAQ